MQSYLISVHSFISHHDSVNTNMLFCHRNISFLHIYISSWSLHRKTYQWVFRGDARWPKGENLGCRSLENLPTELLLWWRHWWKRLLPSWTGADGVNFWLETYLGKFVSLYPYIFEYTNIVSIVKYVTRVTREIYHYI